jgi:hypothetical protein
VSAEGEVQAFVNHETATIIPVHEYRREDTVPHEHKVSGPLCGVEPHHIQIHTDHDLVVHLFDDVAQPGLEIVAVSLERENGRSGSGWRQDQDFTMEEHSDGRIQASARAALCAATKFCEYTRGATW